MISPGRLAAASRYRTTAVLTALVIVGWIWDFVLGGGRAHSIAWLIALVLVGGISATADRHRTDRSTPAPTRQQCQPERQPIRIRLATPADFPRMTEVEVAADTLFRVAGYGETPGPAEESDLAHASLLLVANDPIDGWAWVEIVDGHAHLEGLSVRPKMMRRGIGSALVTAVCDWAVEQGYSVITLCTFADVPWNGPFYAKLGFAPTDDLTPGLRARRLTEADLGLDAMGPRWVMRRELAPHNVAD